MNENDKIITVLTDKVGKIDIVAHGSRKPKSRLIASTQPFCYAEYQVTRGQNLFTLHQSEIIESFQEIIMNLDSVAYGSYFLELFDCLSEKEAKNVSLLALLLKTLYIMTHDDVNLELLKVVVDFKAISVGGYMPRISNCLRCREEISEGYFSIPDGGILCSRCRGSNSSFYLGSEEIKLFKVIKNIKLEDLRNIKYEEKALLYIGDIMTKYIKYHTERDFKSLSLLNHIK